MKVHLIDKTNEREEIDSMMMGFRVLKIIINFQLNGLVALQAMGVCKKVFVPSTTTRFDCSIGNVHHHIDEKGKR